MPDVRVYDPINREMQNDPPDCIYLTLKYAPENKGIDCIVVDGFGVPRENGKLFRITSQGTLQRFKDINPEFGFELDADGAIVLHN